MKTKVLKTLLAFLLVLFLSANLFSQVKNERIGEEDITKYGTNYYNYSDKDKVNIEVSVWGFVKSPGKYLIPMGSTFVDLFTLSGGPQNEAKLNNIRIVRLKNDSLKVEEDKVFVLDYHDYLWEDKIQNVSKTNPVLYPGDIILIPGKSKSEFKENFSLVLTAITTLTSVAVLLITVFRNN
ncbi:MAG: SLBB domain-containing protein [Ignavibacteriae bacterium]|nr:SLBB domain-containing protein [Ignavibacteriota bacterium]